jgi:predicted nucleotidyltransferase
VNDWPGRTSAESLRQWPTLEATVRQIEAAAGLDGAILLGSFATGRADELSDLDLLAVATPGRFNEAWAGRHALAVNLLVTWERRDLDQQIGWFKWLTRDLVKVECGIVDPDAGDTGLAEPFAVVSGDLSLADRFPRIPRAEVERDAARIAVEQAGFDPAAMTAGERIDWMLSELKHAVRLARTKDHSPDRSGP